MKYLIFFALLFTGTTATFAQGESYREKLQTMMQLNGSQETFKVAVGQMIQQMKTLKPEVPHEAWSEMESEFLNTSLEDLTALLIPVYQRHLTAQDLDEIIVFYKTPAGQKLAEKTPTITKESMQAGQEWGRKIGEALGEKLKEKGY